MNTLLETAPGITRGRAREGEGPGNAIPRSGASAMSSQESPEGSPSPHFPAHWLPSGATWPPGRDHLPHPGTQARWLLVLRGPGSFSLPKRLPAPQRLRPGPRHVILQEVFLAFSLTECFQISLLLTSKENESVFFFSLPFQSKSLLQNIKVSMINVSCALKL